MKRKKLLPVPVLILIDALLLGAALCTYALFHHVLHFDKTMFEPVQTIQVDKSAYEKPSPAPAAPAQTEDPETAEPEPQLNDWGQFGPKFYDKFTEGEVIREENLYVSESVRVEYSEMRAYNSDFHLIDIYVRNIENFTTAFAGGSNDGTRAAGLEIAQSVGAVASINGDFPGFSNSGNYLILRNGALYQSNPSRDVCVLYYDGTIKTFLCDHLQVPGFDPDAEMANNAWQGWSFGPALLNEDGTARVLNYGGDYDNPHTALGYYEPGHYCFITVDGRSNTSPGVDLDEFAEFCASLGLAMAYNMDGGQSSTMTFGDAMVNVPPPAEGVREISDIICVVETEAAANE